MSMKIEIKRFMGMFLVVCMMFSNISYINASEKISYTTEEYVIEDYETEDYQTEDNEAEANDITEDSNLQDEEELIIKEESENVEKLELEDLEVQSLDTPLFSGGEGTQGSPFLITTANDLIMLGEYTSGRAVHPLLTQAQFNNAHYAQRGHIDMGFDPNFLPIGFTQNNGFTGNYSGNGYIISNLMINFDRVRSIGGIEAVGLFGYTNNATIRNVEVHNINVIVSGQQRNDIGGIIGHATNTELSRSKIYGGTIDASIANNVGGLVGRADRSTVISDSYVDGVTVIGNNSVGGIVGVLNNNAYIHDSYNNQGTVVGGINVGGIFGVHNTNNTVAIRMYNNYSKADITGVDNVGGIGGRISNTGTIAKTVSNSYSEGTVTGNSNVGGIIGYTEGIGANGGFLINVIDNYTYADLLGNNNVGGIVGNALRRTNISRNYVANTVEVTQSNVGGIVGSITGWHHNHNNNSISALENNLVITEIIAPSTARSGILAASAENTTTIRNNRYSFDSTISGGTVGSFANATEVFALELATPDWWNNVLKINTTNSFDTGRLRDDVLPTVLKRGSTEEVLHQEGKSYSGSTAPTAPEIFYQIGSGINTLMEVQTSGAVVTRVDELTLDVDYYLIGNWVYFTSTYLETLEQGRHMILISLNSGQKIQAFINIVDSEPPVFESVFETAGMEALWNGVVFRCTSTDSTVIGIRNVTLNKMVPQSQSGFTISTNGNITEITFNPPYIVDLAIMEKLDNTTVEFEVNFSDGYIQKISLELSLN